MRHTRNYRPLFLTAAAVRRGEGRRQAYVDAGCDFVLTRPLTMNGRTIPGGTVLDKASVSERTLKQLYDARSLALASGSVSTPTPPRPLAVGPTDLQNPGVARPPEKVKRRGVARRVAA